MNQPPSLIGFTVYRTSDCIIIRSGFTDVPGWHIICSCRSYEQALEAAQSASQIRQLPLIAQQDVSQPLH
ncbi:hypothetical protein [Leptolyngbya ohadii]|uniref:hypothetical protein n=1 Tax=Leptolyngbya ohadii TaxID=1962290 RepID=UPI000B599A77|nr:hypothetical protein [Leptolyngbya ohadii]